MPAMFAKVLVERLVTREAEENRDESVAASLRVSQKLEVRLCKIIGREGFRTLLARAVKLTVRQFPAFKPPPIPDDGSIGGLFSEPHADAEIIVALLEHIVELLSTLIGEDLTLRMVNASWPELQLDAPPNSEREPS
jgi:hypothetical protein